LHNSSIFLSLLIFLHDVAFVGSLKSDGTRKFNKESGSHDNVGSTLTEGWIDGLLDGLVDGCILVDGLIDGLIDGLSDGKLLVVGSSDGCSE